MPISHLVLATHNQGKIKELSRLLQARGIEVTGLDEFPDIGEIPENGATFAENALLKARAVSSLTGLPALADDSGIVVEALQGAPGIYSARFGDGWETLPGESRDERNIRKLLYLMRKIPKHKRACYYECAIAVVTPGGNTLATTGKWPGSVLIAPLGKNGFGYDPVFWDNERAKGAAQMSAREKNDVSHRGRALAALMEKWADFAEGAS